VTKLRNILRLVFRRPAAVALLVTGFLLPGGARAAEVFHWSAVDNRVEVDVDGWTLDRLLAEVSASTGWQVYVEPETERRISARFRGLSGGDALGVLLGNLNFALMPQTDGPPRLLVFRTSAVDATKFVKPVTAPTRAAKNAGKPVPNELVVTLNSGASIDELAAKLGAKVTGRIDDLHAYRLEFEDAEAASKARADLAGNSDVASVENNYYLDRPSPASQLAASSSLPFSLKPTVSADSGKIIIGLIDTKVQPLGTTFDAFMLQGLSIDGSPTTSGGQPLHGTSMAEAILRGLDTASNGGTTPVRVLPVDVYGGKETTTTFAVAWGISKAIENGATIINMSLGSEGESSVLRELIRNSSADGVVFLGAAGNTPTTTTTFPAAYTEVTAVTAGDKRGNIASYANRGSFVDVVGPGLTIVQYNGTSWLVSGTSAATAFMSGMTAGTATTTKRTVKQAESIIRSTFAFDPAKAK
jgi:thermitase